MNQCEEEMNPKISSEWSLVPVSMEVEAPGYLSYGWLSNVDLKLAIGVLLKVFFFFLLRRWEEGKREQDGERGRGTVKRGHGKEKIISLRPF